MSGESTSSDKNERVNSLDDVMELLGTTNTYNVVVILLCALAGFTTPLQVVSSGFLGTTPDYWCQVDQLVEANWTQQQIRNFTSLSNHSCSYPNYNYSEAVRLGYDLVSANPSLVPRLNGTTECHSRYFTQGVHSIVTEWDLVCNRAPLSSTAVASAQCGMLIGSLVFGYVLDRFGRSVGLRIGVVGFIASGFLLSASVNIYMYIIMRTMVMFFSMGLYLGSFVIAIEVCSVRHRSLVGSYFTVPNAVGYMMTAVIAYFFSYWRYLQVALTVPALTNCINFFLVPETPRWLCVQGKYEECIRIMKKFSSKKRDEIPSDVQLLKMLKNLNSHQESSKEQPFNLSQWVNKWLKPQFNWMTPIVFFAWFSICMVYYGLSLGASTLGLNEYVFIFVGGALEIVSYLLLWPTISYFGRRPVLIVTFFVGALSILGVMLMQIMEYQDAWYTILSYSGKFMVTAAFHLMYIVTGELYPTDLRSLVIGESSVFARVGSMISPYTVLLFGGLEWGSAAFFGCFALVSAFLVSFLPETKNRKLDSISSEPQKEEDVVEKNMMLSDGEK